MGQYEILDPFVITRPLSYQKIMLGLNENDTLMSRV